VYTLRSKDDPEQRGKQIVNLACGALGSPSNRVIDAMADYYHKRRVDRDIEWDMVSKQISALLGCHMDRLSFRVNTSSAISGAFTLCKEVLLREYGISEPRLLMSTSEHPAVASIADTQVREGCVQKFTVDDLIKNSKHLKEWLEKWNDCHILFFPHITWVRGTVLDYRKISSAWKSLLEPKFVVIDGAHSLGHVSVQLEIDDSTIVPFDFYATCGHKWLGGPQGSGILYTAQHLRERKYVRERNELLDSFTLHEDHPQAPTGLRPVAYGLLEAAREFCRIRTGNSGFDTWEDAASANFEKILALTHGLRRRLKDLEAKKLVRVLESGTPSSPTGITTFVIPNAKQTPTQLKQSLRKAGYRVTEVLTKEIHGLRVCTSYNIEESDMNGFCSALEKNLVV
jgi:selenocysteine lyase/cysteine desulfurase